MNVEQQAIELGQNRKRLKSRLQSAVGTLHRDIAKHFKSADFDFAGKRLVSSCGKFVLQWYPKHTNNGIVTFFQNRIDNNSDKL